MVLLIFGVSFTLYSFDDSFASYNVGIRLDKTCERLVSLNDTTCPSYDEIQKYFPQAVLNNEYQNIINSENNTANIIYV